MIANKMEASQEICFWAKTRTVRGSDYSHAIALSEGKDIFSNCDADFAKNDPLKFGHRSCQ